MIKIHPALRPELVSRLREEVSPNGSPAAGDGATPAVSAPAAPVPLRQRVTTGARSTARRLIRRSLSWYVETLVQERVDDAAEELERRMRSQEEARAQTVNLELLKGEVRALLHTIDELGTAIAPGTGLEGAAPRMAEQRERLHGLDRRLRQLETSASSSGLAGSASPPAAESTVSRASRFDYMGFERRFRGDPDVVMAALKERYVELLRDHQPVLDIGCGRGELVAALAGEGIEAVGVELDPAMVADAVDRGRNVQRADGLAHLASLPEGSLGAVVAVHVVEHLSLDALLELLELARSRLRPGGVFVAETPNPQSLVVLGNSYVLDPTHVRPLHPSLLAFLCESTGFRHVELRFYEPALDYHLPLVDAPDAPAWASQVNEALSRLNRVLFGPQDYSVTATTPPA